MELIYSEGANPYIPQNPQSFPLPLYPENAASPE
jgi:hypothetical protein